MANDHDLIIQHEQTLNGSDGLVNRMSDIENWKNKYLIDERSKTCIGTKELDKFKEELIKSKEDDTEMTKVRFGAKNMILVALITIVPNLINTFILVFMKK
jgi:hypothetical protein